MDDRGHIFCRLMHVIEDRKANPPAKSYTATLFDGGVERIGAKIMEEAAEVVEAARQSEDERSHLVHEAADLIYHLFVMLGYRDIRLHELQEELERRFGISGLDSRRDASP